MGRTHRLLNMPLPPARLVLIADNFTRPEIMQRMEQAIKGGVHWLLLRDYQAPPEIWESALRVLHRRLPDTVVLSVNRHLEPAQMWHTGFHTGRGGPSVREARYLLGPEALIGYSAHSVEEVQRAREEGADYAFLSPIFPTSSKPEATPAGLEMLQAAAHTVPGFPVFALGGITPARVAACLHTGAYGVAVLSGILHAPDPATAARRYREALAQALS